MLESLIRLSEAHAKLASQKEIFVFDAIQIIILMEHCLNSGLLEELFPVITSFERYQEAKHEILLRLGLNPGDFPDPVIQKRSRRHKKNRSYNEFDANLFMSDRSDFTGMASSQDYRSGTENYGNNFFIDSSQNSTQNNKTGSQSTFSGSQPNRYPEGPGMNDSNMNFFMSL